MKRLLICLVVIAFSLSATACFHNQVITSPDYDPAQEEPDHEEIQIHIMGIITISDPVDLDEVCPGEAGIVESRIFLSNWVSQARVFCAPGGAELDEDSNVEDRLADAR